jgi:tetratricopeptide (TPR) repeat protein
MRDNDKIPHWRSWLPALGAALLPAFVFACGLFPMTDTDVWWHLSAGRWMWEHGTVPRVDPFCASSLGQPWLDAQWGFQLLLLGLWNLGGGFALVLAKALAFAGIFAVIFARAWTPRTTPFLLAAGIFAAFHGRYLADVRPIWVTVLLLAWQYRLLRDYLDGRSRLPGAVLAALLAFSQVVMVQMQGLYWLGPAQFAVMFLGSGDFRKKPLLLLGGALLVASLVNPYGWRGWSLPLELLARILPVPGNLFSREVAENIPFWRWLSENPAEAIPFLVMAVVAAGLLAWTRARKARGEAGLLLMYGVLGAMAQRNLLLFLLAFLIVVARAVPFLVMEGRAAGFRIRIAAAFGFAWSMMSLVGYAADLRASWKWERPGAWETPFRFPEGAAAYLREHPLRGTLFNEMRHGGYLGWHLWPAYRPFIDGRMILHDATFMREFLDLFDHPERFEAYRRRHGIQIVLLPIGEDDRYLKLAAFLAGDSAWSLLYGDGAEVLLARPEAWQGGAAPKAWTPGDGAAAARARFGGNPLLLERAEQRIAAFLGRTAGIGTEPVGEDPAGTLLDRVLAAEEATAKRFPPLSSPTISLRDSLEDYRRRLAAANLPSLSEDRRAEILAHFLFDSLQLKSLDGGEDFGLSLPSRILRDRKGSCAGLALLLMALAEKTGHEARPVFLPGHLFVRLKSGSAPSASWRNVELLRGGVARSDSFYADAFQLRRRPWYRLVSREPSQVLAAFYFNRGNAYRDAGRPERAIEEYRRAENLLPGFPEALGSEGALLWSRGSGREGREKLEKSLAGDPLSKPARENYEWYTRQESNL